MRVGIAIIHDNDLASGVISDVEGSPDNHVAFRVVDATGDHKIEAIYGYGVVDDNWSILEHQNRTVIHLYEPAFDLTPAIYYARNQVGKPYSLMSILGAGLAKVWGWFARGRRHNIFGGWNCARLVMRSLQEAKYPGSQHFDSGGATPAMIADLMDWNKEPEWTS